MLHTNMHTQSLLLFILPHSQPLHPSGCSVGEILSSGHRTPSTSAGLPHSKLMLEWIFNVTGQDMPVILKNSSLLPLIYYPPSLPLHLPLALQVNVEERPSVEQVMEKAFFRALKKDE